MPTTESEIVYYIWFLISVTALIAWLWRTSAGRQAFSNAPVREHNINIGDLAVISVVMFILAPMLVATIFKRPEEPDWPKFNRFFLANIAVSAGLIITMLLIARSSFTDKLNGFGLRAGFRFRSLLRLIIYSITAFGLTFLTLKTTILIYKLLGSEQVQKHPYLEYFQYDPPTVSIILLIISAGLAVPIMEELLFRGLLQSFLSNKISQILRCSDNDGADDYRDLEEYPTSSISTSLPSSARWAAIFLSSLIFALLHPSPQQWPALTVLAICFGYAYERTGSLTIPIIMHSLFNLLALTVNLLTQTQVK